MIVLWVKPSSSSNISNHVGLIIIPHITTFCSDSYWKLLVHIPHKLPIDCSSQRLALGSPTLKQGLFGTLVQLPDTSPVCYWCCFSNSTWQAPSQHQMHGRKNIVRHNSGNTTTNSKESHVQMIWCSKCCCDCVSGSNINISKNMPNTCLSHV